MADVPPAPRAHEGPVRAEVPGLAARRSAPGAPAAPGRPVLNSADAGEHAVDVPAGGVSTPAPAARKRGRPAAHERETRRGDILRAATATFLAHGYSATTLDQIAAAGQVTKRTVYTYVGDKAAVFTAVVDQLHHDVVAQAGAADASDLLGLSTRIVRTLLSDEGVGLHRLVIAEAASFPDLAATFYATGPRQYMVALADAISSQGADDGDADDGGADDGGGDDGGGAGEASAWLDEAEQLFGLLLGEAHRRRLLGLEPAPDRERAQAHARAALASLGLLRETA